MKKILAIEDSIIEPNKIFLGELWTAKLILANKLNDSQIIFSNSEFSIVIDIDLNPEEKMYA